MSFARFLPPRVFPLFLVLLAPVASAQWGYTETFDSGPGDGSLEGLATVEDGELRITSASEPGGNGTWVISPGVTLPALEVAFDLLIGGGGGADGFSFSYSDYDGGALTENGDASPGLAVRIITYAGGNPRIEVAYNNAVVHSATFTSAQLRPNSYQRFRLSVTNDRAFRLTWNGLTVTTTLPEWNPQPSWDIILAARIGGLNDNHFVDNLVISGTAPRTASLVRMDSNPRNIATGNTGRWLLTMSSPVMGTGNMVVGILGGGGNQQYLTDPLVDVNTDFNTDASPGTLGGGATVSGGSLRLTEAVGNRSGSWSYSPGTPANSFRAAFDLLIGNGSGADGFGFHYGPNNEGEVYFEGDGTGLTVAFDTYSNPGETAPDISIRYEGVDLAVVRRTLRTGSFVPVVIQVTSDGICTLYHNSELIAAAVIPGWAPADNWDFALSANTGGLHDQHYVDNLMIRSGTYQAGVNNFYGFGEVGLVIYTYNVFDYNTPNANRNNPPTFTGGEDYYIDFSRPTAILSSTSNSDVNGPITVNLTTNEPVVNLTEADINTVNATVSGFTGSSTIYSFMLTPIEPGTFGAQVAGGGYEDLAGNASDTASNLLSRNYDNVLEKPDVRLDLGGSLRNKPLRVNIDTKEFTTNFDINDISATKATLSDFTGTGRYYSVQVTPFDQGKVVVTVHPTYTDAAGNSPEGDVSVDFTYDSISPTPLFTSSAGPKVNSSIVVALDAGESTSNLVQADLQTSNAVVSDFAGPGRWYTFTLHPNAEGLFSVTLPAGVYTDAAENTNTGPVTFTREYDATVPLVQSTVPSAGATVASLGSISVLFTEEGTGVTADKLEVDGSPATAVTGSGAGPYIFNGFADPGQGPANVTLGAGIFDAAGNTVASANWSYTVNSDIPSVTLSSGTIADGGAANVAFHDFSVVWSEDVSGFDAGDIQVTNATISGFAGSGASYSFRVTPAVDGAVTVQILAGAATAVIPPFNQSAESGTFLFIHDVTPPVLVMDGDNPAIVSCGSGFNDPGASAVDEIGGNLSNYIVISGDAIASNTSPIGSPYEIVYTVTDAAGNQAQETRSVIVLDDCPLNVQAAGGITEVQVNNGANVTLQVVVSGNVGQPEFEWQRNTGAKTWEHINGAPSSPTLSITGFGPADEGEYRCVVNDEVAIVVSPVFTLSLGSQPVPVAGLCGLAALSAALGAGIARRRRK